MADFKQIKVGNTTYDVKDETARNAISNLTSASLPYSTDPTEGSTKEKIDSNGFKVGTNTITKPITLAGYTTTAGAICYTPWVYPENAHNGTVTAFDVSVYTVDGNLTPSNVSLRSIDAGNRIGFLCETTGHTNARNATVLIRSMSFTLTT